MRCTYMSDLHLEHDDLAISLPGGDVLIVAGDTCQAAALDPQRTDPYAATQRDRVKRFFDRACERFRHVLVVAGNHEHYDGLFEDTVPLLRRHLAGVHVLDDEAIEIGGVSFFGSTLWSDFEGRNPDAMERARRGSGDYFFIRSAAKEPDRRGRPGKILPGDTLARFDAAMAALQRHLRERATQQTVVITHHAPSHKGGNPGSTGNGLDGAYTSALDPFIEGANGVPFWVHGHTHIRRTYRIGNTVVAANCRGLLKRDPGARTFVADRWFEL